VPRNVRQLRRGHGAAQVFVFDIEHLVGIGQGAGHHLLLAHALLGRQIHRHAAHGALRQHPHRPERIPRGGGFLGLVVLGQDLGQRLGQDFLQLRHLGLQRFQLRLALQCLGSGVGGSVRCCGHGQAAVGVGLGDGEGRSDGHGQTER